MLFSNFRRFMSGLAVLVTMTGVDASGPALADSNTVITKQSKFGAGETLNRLSKILEAKGITVFARVDHAAGAKKVGKELPATQLLIFGNPKLGTPLMTANRAIGLDLPMKALAWTDESGKTFLSYTAPSSLKARWSITERDKIFAKMTGALDKFTNAATGN